MVNILGLSKLGYYVLQIKTFDIKYQLDEEIKEIPMYGEYLTKPKSQSQIIESIKTLLLNELYLAYHSSKFNKVIFHKNLDKGCVAEIKYFIASSNSMRVDKVYLKYTSLKNNKVSRLIEWKEYKPIWKALKDFIKVIYNREKGDERLCIM